MISSVSNHALYLRENLPFTVSLSLSICVQISFSLFFSFFTFCSVCVLSFFNISWILSHRSLLPSFIIKLSIARYFISMSSVQFFCFWERFTVSRTSSTRTFVSTFHDAFILQFVKLLHIHFHLMLHCSQLKFDLFIFFFAIIPSLGYLPDFFLFFSKSHFQTLVPFSFLFKISFGLNNNFF